MVASLFHPLNIFLLGLGGGFAIPLLVRVGAAWLSAGFFSALVGIGVVSGVSLIRVLGGEPPVDILTAGSPPPLSISLRFGLPEGFVVTSVNVIAILGALHLWDRLRGNYAALLLYLGLTMGINGMVMTRDLFNLFVFLEMRPMDCSDLSGHRPRWAPRSSSSWRRSSRRPSSCSAQVCSITSPARSASMP
jgi:formate hydrogenlyase subunit 3/multisubunit Na+/H+ antiporter MnhD subunit